MTNNPDNDRTEDLTVPTPDAPTDVDNHAAPSAAPDAGHDVEPAAPAVAEDDAKDKKPQVSTSVTSSIAGSTWVGLSIGAVILILLLVFILQNQDSVRLQMFAWQWNFPIGVGMLIAAIGGALVMACVCAVRILQLRRQIHHPKNRKRGKGRKNRGKR